MAELQPFIYQQFIDDELEICNDTESLDTTILYGIYRNWALYNDVKYDIKMEFIANMKMRYNYQHSCFSGIKLKHE